MSKSKKGLLERLDDGVVIGDGGYAFALEKRGYVNACSWTSEVTRENPEALKQLHYEFLRAGSDVLKCFCDDTENENQQQKTDLACKIAKKMAHENMLIAGCLLKPKDVASKEDIEKIYKKKCEIFVENGVDFIIVESYESVNDIEQAIKVAREFSVPVLASMQIGELGDVDNVSIGDCAIRMARSGAQIIGVNCHSDPFVSLNAIDVMKKSLESNNIKVHLATQPTAFHGPDVGKGGLSTLPEYPYALEARYCTRWDMQKYAREAYELGVRYIGGGFGFEAYHTRALSQELYDVRKVLPESSDKHEPWGGGLRLSTYPFLRERITKSYWANLPVASGRPFNPSLSVASQ